MLTEVIWNFFFYPSDENEFKSKALEKKVVCTVIFDTKNKRLENIYCRAVGKLLEQTRKNNIETDHRVKKLAGDHYQIYSWVAESVRDFGLPSFVKQD